MLTYKPKVGQWVVYGPKCLIGKITATCKRYEAMSGRPWGPVTRVYVGGTWYGIEEVKHISPKERMKLTQNSLY